MSQRIRAAAYYRMSDDKQENSIDRQKSQVEPYSARRGYEIVRVYIDEGISGSEVAKRKDFQRMLKDAQTSLFDVILCDDKDRFSRLDSIDEAEIIAPLRRKGICLETVAQGRLDWNSFAGRVSDLLLKEAKQIEQAAISRRVLTGQRERARQGKSTGSRALYGRRWADDPILGKRQVADGRKADVVQLVFAMYDRGETLCAIALELYRRGVPSPKGKLRWTRSVIQRLLTNRRYTGDRTWGVHSSGKRYRHAGTGEPRQKTYSDKTQDMNPPDAWVVVADRDEPLVTREVFERVQARLQGNQVRTTPLPGGGNFALGRMLVCSHCGSFLRGVTEYGKRRYVCGGYLAYGKGHCKRNGVPEGPLVRHLVRLLQEQFLDPENLQRLRDEIADQEAKERGPANRGRLLARIEALGREIDQGNENLTILPPDRLPGVIERLRAKEQERDGLQAELSRLDTESAARDLEKEIALAESLLWRLQESVKAEDLPLLREVLREMVARVELRWTHKEHGSLTKARFEGGTVYLRASEGLSRLSPSASR
jgi:site-specific DNA recombinase